MAIQPYPYIILLFSTLGKDFVSTQTYARTRVGNMATYVLTLAPPTQISGLVTPYSIHVRISVPLISVDYSVSVP